MKIIFLENEQEHNRLNELSKTETFIFLPLCNSDVHPLHSKCVVVFAKPLLTDELFIISFLHSECISIKNLSLFTQFKKAFIYNKKYFKIPDCECIDIESIYYVQNKELKLDLFKHDVDWKIYPIYKLIDKIIPIMKEFSVECNEFISKGLENNSDIEFLNTVTIPVLAELESKGIKYNDSILYSQYNHLTITGRPSNRYGGINYSALSKSDGSRLPFISRFENGALFMLDYDSYHLRLIAKLINYTLPKTSVHTHFAMQYFNTDEITDELYEESKKITFKLLYGGLTEEYEHIQFFKNVQIFIDKLWQIHQQLGYINSVISGIKITADSKTKLFNYLIQKYETEQNMIVLHKIFLQTKNFESTPILYTYDSLLFDIKEEETESYLHLVKKIMQLDDEFPVKISFGKNYHELVKI